MLLRVVENNEINSLAHQRKLFNRTALKNEMK